MHGLLMESCKLSTEQRQLHYRRTYAIWRSLRHRRCLTPTTLYSLLGTTAINDIRHLGVVCEYNIQYALNSTSQEYCIIAVKSW